MAQSFDFKIGQVPQDHLQQTFSILICKDMLQAICKETLLTYLAKASIGNADLQWLCLLSHLEAQPEPAQCLLVAFQLSQREPVPRWSFPVSEASMIRSSIS